MQAQAPAWAQAQVHAHGRPGAGARKRPRPRAPHAHANAPGRDRIATCGRRWGEGYSACLTKPERSAEFRGMSRAKIKFLRRRVKI